jgi:hypothetical protein
LTPTPSMRSAPRSNVTVTRRRTSHAGATSCSGPPGRSSPSSRSP